MWYLSFSLWLSLLSLVPSKTVVAMALFVIFYSWVIFHCVYVPYILYPFIYGWTFSLLPCLGYCTQCYYEHQLLCSQSSAWRKEPVHGFRFSFEGVHRRWWPLSCLMWSFPIWWPELLCSCCCACVYKSLCGQMCQSFPCDFSCHFIVKK